MTPDIATIAAGLSEAQRRALMAAVVREPASFMPNYRAIELTAGGMSGAETEELKALGLVTLPICIGPRSGWPIYHGEIHPTGLAVRAYLQEQTS